MNHEQTNSKLRTRPSLIRGQEYQVLESRQYQNTDNLNDIFVLEAIEEQEGDVLRSTIENSDAIAVFICKYRH